MSLAVAIAAVSGTPRAAEPESARAQPDESKGIRTAARIGLDLSSNEAPLQINANRQTLSERADGGRISEWSGGVVLIQGDLRLTSERLQIYFASEDVGGAVERIEAEGTVEIEQRDVLLRCDRAVYEEKTCQAVCERIDACSKKGPLAEPALLRQGGDTVKGGRIEFDVCSGDFQVSCGASGYFQPRSRSSSPRSSGAEASR